MRKILYMLGELNDQDLDWIFGVGVAEETPSGQLLVQQGKRIEVLYIIIQGCFAVSMEGADTIAELAAGEVVGELSFLDSRPPGASVTAIEKSTVLAIPVSRLNAKLKTDTGFASRFYRALGILLAHRLRDTTIQLGSKTERRLDEDVEEFGEMSPELLDKMNLAAARFDMLLRRVELQG